MSEANEPICGSCGKIVATSDVTCPHCGVLLAAYQSPSGAAVGSASATSPVQTATTIPAPPLSDYSSPVTPPAPTSDPLRSPFREAMSRPTTPGTAAIGSDQVADELSKMAKDDSGFARRVEAELKDAKVVFDDKAGATIETASAAENVVVVAPRQDRATRQASKPPEPAQTTLETEGLPESTGPEPIPSEPGTSKPSGINAIVVVVAIIFFFTVFRNPGAVGFLIIAVALGVIFFKVAISATKSNSRSTTWMPRDKSNRRNRRR